MYDVIVIGGGIVGASTAFHLADNGSDTLLVDREDDGRATSAGAGIVSPATTRHTGNAWYELGLAAGRYYPELVGKVEGCGVTETGFGQPGVLIIDIPDRDQELYTDGLDRIFDRQARYGYPAEDRLYEVSTAEARELFPAVADVRNALYYEDGARVDGRVFQRALIEAGQVSGLAVERGTADRVVVKNDAVSGVIIDGEQVDAGNIVIAGGAWSNEFGEQLGVDIPVSPQRGQIVHLDLGGTDTSEWPIINSFYGYYFVPWDDGRVAAGATRESGVGFVPKTTVDGIHEVLSETLEMTPGLGSASIEEIRVGLRPESQDGMPIIGESPRVAGGYIVTGHGPSGLTLGPYSGKCIESIIHEDPIDIDLSAFSPDRFNTEG